MRSRITGTLERLDPPPHTATPTATIVLQLAAPADAAPPHDTAFDVLLPAYVAEHLESQRNTTVTLHTIELLEAQGQGSHLIPRLIGFTRRDDRAFFNLFTTVKNLGPRKALRAMTAPPSDIASAIAAKDAESLQRLPGVGQRLAETIVAELAGKADRFIAPPSPDAAPSAAAEFKPHAAPPSALAQPPFTPAQEDTLGALVRLGTPRHEAERRLHNAMHNNPALAEPNTSPDQLLAAALAASP